MRTGRAVAVASAALVVAMLIGVSVGPAGLPLWQVIGALLEKLPWQPRLAVPPVTMIMVAPRPPPAATPSR